MPDKISIRIDGEYVAAEVGQTILEVARAGEQISFSHAPAGWKMSRRWAPAACASWRSRGVNRLLPACDTTPVQDRR